MWPDLWKDYTPHFVFQRTIPQIFIFQTVIFSKAIIHAPSTCIHIHTHTTYTHIIINTYVAHTINTHHTCQKHALLTPLTYTVHTINTHMYQIKLHSWFGRLREEICNKMGSYIWCPKVFRFRYSLCNMHIITLVCSWWGRWACAGWHPQGKGWRCVELSEPSGFKRSCDGL